MMKYITEEIINDFNKELEMIGSSIRYDFYADPDGFEICNRGKFRITDEFIEQTTIFKLTDKFYSFVEGTFKRKYHIDVRVCEMTGNIWVAD